MSLKWGSHHKLVFYYDIIAIGEEKMYETTKGFFHNTFIFEQYKKKNFNKWFKTLTCSDLKDQQKVSDFLSWANIYYVPPGYTLSMLNLWNDTGFSKTLKEAPLNNKTFAGTSAVAIDGEEYRIIVPKRYIGLSESTEFPLITNLEDGRYSYTEVKKTTEYHRTENKLVLKK